MKNKTSDVTKVSLVEFFKISWWSLGLIFRIQPFYAGVYFVGTAISRIQPIINSFIFAKTIDALITAMKTPGSSITVLYPYLLAMLVYGVVDTIVTFSSRHSVNALRYLSQYRIRQILYTKVYGLGIQTLEQPEIQNQLQRSNEYINQIIPFASDLVETVAGITRLVSALFLVAVFLPIFIPIILLLTVPYMLYDRHFRGKVYKFSFENTEGSRKANASAADLTLMRSLQEIYINGAFKYFDSKYQIFMAWYNQVRLNILKSWRFGNEGFGFLVDVAVLGGAVQVFTSALRGLISVGDVTFRISNLSLFEQAVVQTMSSFNDLLESSIQLQDVYRLFKTEPVVKDGQIVLAKFDSGPSINFDNVSFKYPNNDRYIFKGLDLTIKPGEKIALVGPNGVGKTTLVKLLCRFYNTTEGRILINDHNLNDLQIASLYKNMGVFFQDFETYPQLTVKENIIAGDPSRKVLWSEIMAAAKDADCLDFIHQYKDGFDQVLSEQYKGGIRPSTGQWQKLVMARFFYRDSPLVIFDEPTSAIDAVSEAKIFDKIYDSFKGKTVIIVSHRFSTVRNADRIIVLKNGKIVEEGSHQKLLKLDGEYAHSYNLQAKGYTDD